MSYVVNHRLNHQAELKSNLEAQATASLSLALVPRSRNQGPNLVLF